MPHSVAALFAYVPQKNKTLCLYGLIELADRDSSSFYSCEFEEKIIHLPYQKINPVIINSLHAR